MVTASSADLFSYDMEMSGGGELAGADEAGRGCLAGPLVAAAVVFDYSRVERGRFARLMEELHDSKLLTPEKRESLLPEIIGAASRFAVVVAASRTIDRDGLHITNLRILEQSLKRLSPVSGRCLVDGYPLQDQEFHHEPIKGGDSLSACIAAASVLAKVSRDRVMVSLDSLYPDYNFAQHKGYATREHRRAIAENGFCALHRRSFRINPVKEEGTA